MTNFLQWYKQNTKNKIIIFSIAFIFTLAYSFLHRPLGLIMWYEFRYAKENKLMKDDLREVWHDEKSFLNLYHDFYEKQNIDKKSKEIEKELLHYIDNLERDLLASSFVGLDEHYLLALAHRAFIYTCNVDWQLELSIVNNFYLSQEQTNDYLLFLQSFKKVLFFVNRLDYDYLKLIFNDVVIRFMFVFVEIAHRETICDNEIHLINMIDATNNKMQEFKNTKFEAVLQENYLKIIEQESIIVKEKLNGCQSKQWHYPKQRSL